MPKMEEKMAFENCEICQQPITNPVCPECYLDELYAWMQSMKIREVPRNIIIEILRRKLSGDTMNENRCILCGSENVGICTRCFFEITEQVLKELNFPRDAIESYDGIFSYQ